MKTIITIIAILLVAGGVWWYFSDDTVVTNTPNGEVNGASDEFNADVDIDLGEFDSKG